VLPVRRTTRAAIGAAGNPRSGLRGYLSWGGSRAMPGGVVTSSAVSSIGGRLGERLEARQRRLHGPSQLPAAADHDVASGEVPRRPHIVE
jgi:hypothetical protein